MNEHEVAQRLAGALIDAMCKSDSEWDRARAKEIRAHMRTALAAVGMNEHEGSEEGGGGLSAAERVALIRGANDAWADLEARLAAVEALVAGAEAREAASLSRTFDGGSFGAWVDAASIRAALANPSAAQRESEGGARLARAWEEGAYAGQTYQREIQRHAHWSHIGKALPDPIANPYRADALTTDEAEVPRWP